MSYDWHFSDGNHTKMSNWTVHTAVMLAYYAIGVWSYKRLESELTTLQMWKNEMQDAFQKSVPTENVTEGLHTTITVNRFETDSDEYKEAKEEGLPVTEKDGFAWIAQVTFEGKEPPKQEFIDDFLNNMKIPLLYATRNSMRCDSLLDECPEAFRPTYAKVLLNDGALFDANDAATLIHAFMPLTSVKKVDDSVLRKLEEIIDPDWTNLIGCCGRIVMKDVTALIY